MSTDLKAAAKRAGIVGAGGAGFPTHVKLAAKADTVIINGAECEPLLRVDQLLMAEQAEKLLTALEMIMQQVGAARGVVALKGHYHDAVQALNKTLPNHKNLSLFEMGSFYPAGDEQVLVAEVTGRIVPEGGIPIQVGVVVCNVETALNLYDAQKNGAPVIEKYVTLTGEVRQPKTVKVPVGITVREAIELAGGATVNEYEVVNGGPMMGKVVPMDSLVTKTTKGLIVLPKGHSLLVSLNQPLQRSLRNASIACMQCSLCTEVCPRANIGHRMYPHKLMRMAAYGSLCDENDTPMNAYLCCGCRLCEYACVMQLQPWKLNDNIKKVMGENGIRNSLNAQPECVDPFRETKRYPVHKLITQLGLDAYDRPAPMDDGKYVFNKVTLPLRQHVGAPAEPVIKQGDRVEKGMLIASMSEGKLGADIHASISGVVKSVLQDSISIASS